MAWWFGRRCQVCGGPADLSSTDVPALDSLALAGWYCERCATQLWNPPDFDEYEYDEFEVPTDDPDVDEEDDE